MCFFWIKIHNLHISASSQFSLNWVLSLILFFASHAFLRVQQHYIFRRDITPHSGLTLHNKHLHFQTFLSNNWNYLTYGVDNEAIIFIAVHFYLSCTHPFISLNYSNIFSFRVIFTFPSSWHANAKSCYDDSKNSSPYYWRKDRKIMYPIFISTYIKDQTKTKNLARILNEMDSERERSPTCN